MPRGTFLFTSLINLKKVSRNGLLTKSPFVSQTSSRLFSLLRFKLCSPSPLKKSWPWVESTQVWWPIRCWMRLCLSKTTTSWSNTIQSLKVKIYLTSAKSSETKFSQYLAIIQNIWGIFRLSWMKITSIICFFHFFIAKNSFHWQKFCFNSCQMILCWDLVRYAFLWIQTCCRYFSPKLLLSSDQIKE